MFVQKVQVGGFNFNQLRLPSILNIIIEIDSSIQLAGEHCKISARTFNELHVFPIIVYYCVLCIFA